MAGGAVRLGRRWRGGAVSRHSPPSGRRKHIHSAPSTLFLQIRHSAPPAQQTVRVPARLLREDVFGRFDNLFARRWKSTRRPVRAITRGPMPARPDDGGHAAPASPAGTRDRGSDPAAEHLRRRASGDVSPPPTTRAPISLSPEPRVPFRARTRLGRTTRVAGYSCGLPYPTRHTTVGFPATTQHSVRGNRPFTLIFCQRRWT